MGGRREVLVRAALLSLCVWQMEALCQGLWVVCADMCRTRRAYEIEKRKGRMAEEQALQNVGYGTTIISQATSRSISNCRVAIKMQQGTAESRRVALNIPQV